MKQVHYKIRYGLLGLIDFFYPVFRRFMPLQMYRYAACGGSNTLLSILLYFISYNFILQKKVLHLGIIAFTPHIAALLIATCITFPIGFYLSMYVVFQGSYLKKRIQLFRYFLVAAICFVLNYILLKTFVEVLGWYPTPSQIVTVCMVVTFSYISQKHFSFRNSNRATIVPQQDPVH